MPRSPQVASRRLTTSRSAGDLQTLAKSGGNNKTLEQKPSKKEKKNNDRDNGYREPVTSVGFRTRVVTLPDPEASVVCGELYRLSLFGVWCRLWLELRLCYLLFFYNRDDSLPIDVVHLRGYSVHKAPECDHLEGLYPMKIACRDEGKIFFFYAENEECRVKWMAALWRACSTKPSLTIEGLNLEPEKNAESRRGSAVSDETEEEAQDDKLTELPFDNSVFYLSHGRTSKKDEEESQKATAICNAYNRIQELAEHEVLRMSTYYMQRRLSTQIKMQTLQDQLDEGSTSIPVTGVEQKLHDLSDRLQEIESCKEETERVAEQKLHQLKARKLQYLTRLSNSNPSLATAATSEDSEHEEPPITIITQTQKSKEVELRSKSKSGLSKAKAVERHRTFSPGDWHMVVAPQYVATKSSLRKVGSLDDIQQEAKNKRKGPLRLWSHVRIKMSSATESDQSGESSPSPKTSHRRKLFSRSTSHEPKSSSTFHDVSAELSLQPSGNVTQDANNVQEVASTSACETDSPSSLPPPPHQHHSRHPNLKKTIKRFFSFSGSRHHSSS